MTLSIDEKDRQKKILIVDDSKHILFSLEIVLKSFGFSNIIKCSDSRNVLELFKDEDISLLIIDLMMPYFTGEEIVDLLREKKINVPIIVLTGVNEVESSVKLLKKGVFDYILKPIDKNRIYSSITNAFSVIKLKDENKKIKNKLISDSLESPQIFKDIITNNEKMFSIFKYIEAISESHEPILITGETGTGKELIAKSIHETSKRKGKFIPINVSAIESNMFNDSLYGHKKGSFTNASESRKGFIEQAENGTLFLDEIGDLTMDSQKKLLRFLQEGEYYPIGSDISKKANCRIVVATNCNLNLLVETKKFRSDLFYRIKTHHIELPPLRKRRSDLSLLIEYFISRAEVDLKKSNMKLDSRVYELLSKYEFPGNIRELRAIIYDGLTQSEDGIIPLSYFEKYMGKSIETNKFEDKTFSFPEKLPTIKEMTQLLIDEALRRSKNNQSLAAKLLGITRQALNKRLKKLKNEVEL